MVVDHIPATSEVQQAKPESTVSEESNQRKAEEAEKKRQDEEEAEKKRKAEEEAAAQAAEAQRRKEVEAAKVPADGGLPITFRDPTGAKTYTVSFTTKPLGMDFKHDQKPVKIINAIRAAKTLGVQEGSELLNIAGTDVEQMDFSKIIALLREKAALLQPDGLVIVFRDLSGQQKTVVFATQPLDIEFDQSKKPMKVAPLQRGAAHSHGVQANWELLSIAGTDVGQMEYDKVMELLQSQVGALPTKE